MVPATAIGEAIRQAVPPWLLPVVVGVTHLGNVGVFLTLFTLDYWFRDSRRAAHAIAVVIGGMAFIAALKAFFAEPRPPASVNVVPTSGFSFPSGHAAGATIAYGVLAFDLKARTRRLRFAAAGVLVALVSLSRVVLGVHFVRDVVAGVSAGAVFLAATVALTRRAPRPGFLLAAGLGVVALVVTDVSHVGVSVFGASLGAAVAWEALRRTARTGREGGGRPIVPRVASRRGRAILAGVVLPALAVIAYFSTRTWVPLPAVFVLNATLLGGLLTSPHLVTGVDGSETPESVVESTDPDRR